jgi:hypothetical protein
MKHVSNEARVGHTAPLPLPPILPPGLLPASPHDSQLLGLLLRLLLGYYYYAYYWASLRVCRDVAPCPLQATAARWTSAGGAGTWQTTRPSSTAGCRPLTAPWCTWKRCATHQHHDFVSHWRVSSASWGAAGRGKTFQLVPVVLPAGLWLPVGAAPVGVPHRHARQGDSRRIVLLSLIICALRSMWFGTTHVSRPGALPQRCRQPAAARAAAACPDVRIVISNRRRRLSRRTHRYLESPPPLVQTYPSLSRIATAACPDVPIIILNRHRRLSRRTHRYLESPPPLVQTYPSLSRIAFPVQMIVCERGDLVFVFNFHPSRSYTDYRVGCQASGAYKVRHGCRTARAVCMGTRVEQPRHPHAAELALAPTPARHAHACKHSHATVPVCPYMVVLPLAP